MHRVFNERDCVLRNKQNYDSLLLKKNVKLSGIKVTCVFNKIDNFHITNNLAIDPQHDLQEGVLRLLLTN